jgi:hypothetical protein
MIIKRLFSRRFIITVSALVLEGSSMLGLDVHVDCGLILLHEGAVGALELSISRAQIVKSHFGDSLCCTVQVSIFAALWYKN